jgi:circadian clock protein KaiB
MSHDGAASQQQPTAVERIERVATGGGEYHLRLYVAGTSAKSMDAFNNLKRLCDAHLADRYQIEIIDLLQHPQSARGDEIVAVPTLVRQFPVPMRKIIGDLSDTERVLLGLELEADGTG